jgi:cytoskeleton protein RodZ
VRWGVTEVSRRLQAARERAGLTIADISARTKIGAAALQAIERGDFAKLPGDFYTRAFLRTYARELRLPADEIVQEYDAARMPAQPFAAHTPLHRGGPGDPVSPSLPDRAAAQPDLPSPWPQIMAVASNGGVVVALAVGLLVVTVVRNRPVPDRPREPQVVGTSGATQAVPVSSAGSAGMAPPSAEPEKLILDIQPTGPTWVTGAADGKRVLYRLLAPGERVTVEARNDLTFRVGNAVAFNYSINGVPGKPLGGPDEIREFQITRKNYPTFRR